MVIFFPSFNRNYAYYIYEYMVTNANKNLFLKPKASVI